MYQFWPPTTCLVYRVVPSPWKYRGSHSYIYLLLDKSHLIPFGVSDDLNKSSDAFQTEGGPVRCWPCLSQGEARGYLVKAGTFQADVRISLRELRPGPGRDSGNLKTTSRIRVFRFRKICFQGILLKIAPGLELSAIKLFSVAHFEVSINLHEQGCFGWDRPKSCHLEHTTRFTMKYRWLAPKHYNANLGIRRVGKPQDVLVCLQYF